MGRFDISKLKYITAEEWRILTGTEMGMKNHEIVPMSLVASLANLKRGGAHKILKDLSQERLICWEKAKQGKIFGYRLTWAGYDHLSLRALNSKGILHSVGKQIGVGKESDVYIGLGRDLQEIDKQKDIDYMNKIKYYEDNNIEFDETKERNRETKPKIGYKNRNAKDTHQLNYQLTEEELNSIDNTKQIAIKIHRLGRTCFRQVKNKREYSSANHTSWIYLARLAATREYSFQKCLHDRGFSVPKPLGLNRHIVIMELVRGHPLNKIDNLSGHEQSIFNQLMNMVVNLLEHGIVHGDLNEFNIMVEDIDENGEILEIPKALMIDFPQMVSSDHVDAKKMFYRDVEGITKFFENKFELVLSEKLPDFDEIVKKMCNKRLDETVDGTTGEGIGSGKNEKENLINWKMDLMAEARKLGNEMQGGWAALPKSKREDGIGDEEEEMEEDELDEEDEEVDELEDLQEMKDDDDVTEIKETNKESDEASDETVEHQTESTDQLSDMSPEFTKRLSQIKTNLTNITGTTSVPPDQIKLRVKKAIELSKHRDNHSKLRKHDRTSLKVKQNMMNDIKHTLSEGHQF